MIVDEADDGKADGGSFGAERPRRQAEDAHQENRVRFHRFSCAPSTAFVPRNAASDILSLSPLKNT